jgi:hypothetical protein
MSSRARAYYYLKLRLGWMDDPTIGMLASDGLRWRYLQTYLQAGIHDKDGLLPPVPQMAYRFRVPLETLERELAVLSDAGLLERTDDGWLVVNYASEQAPVTDAERAREYRRKRKQDESEQDESRQDESKEDKIIVDKTKQESVTKPSRQRDVCVTVCDNDVTDTDNNNDVFRAYTDALPDGSVLSKHDRRVLLDLTEQHGQERVLGKIGECALSANGGQFNMAYLVAAVGNPDRPAGARQASTSGERLPVWDDAK